MIDYARLSESQWEILLDDWNPPVPRKVVRIHLGASPTLVSKSDRRDYVIEQHKSGLSMQRIALNLGVSLSLISRIISNTR